MLNTKFRSEDKPEVLNMNILFNSGNIRWDGTNYVEVIEEDINEPAVDFDDSDEDEEDGDN